MSSLFGKNSFNDRNISQTQNENNSLNKGYNFGNNILWRHRFGKIGRTLSVGLNTSINDRNGESGLNSIINYFVYLNSRFTAQTIDQQTQTSSNGYTVSSSVSLTENIGRGGQLELSYRPSFTKNYSERNTYNFDKVTSEYSTPDLRLSNEFDNTYFTNRIGGSYRFRINKTSLSAELNYQNAQLNGQQNYPLQFEVKRTFDNILPGASLRYNGTGGQSMRIFYRTSTNAPSISQLQNVVDNSNPLFLKTLATLI
ncbi:MAG: outer membrane beta-barrel protein [Spirosomataceae bacterium]